MQMHFRNNFNVLLPYLLWLTVVTYYIAIVVNAQENNLSGESEKENISPKVKVVKRLRNFLTDFLTEEQCIDFIDTYLKMYHEGATFEEIKEDIMVNGMDRLEDEQLLAALGAYKKANKALGSEKIMALGDTCLTVISNNLSPFMKQVLAKVQFMEEQKKGVNAINNQIFLMVNQFFTKKRCRTILQRIMNKIGKEDFNLAYPFLTSFLKFDLISDLM